MSVAVQAARGQRYFSTVLARASDQESAMPVPASSNPWIGTFAGHLLKLDPRISPTHAVQCAVANIHLAGHLLPEEAARIVARDRAASQETASHTAHSARYRELFAG